MDFENQFISALKSYCILRNIQIDDFFEASLKGSENKLSAQNFVWKEMAHRSKDELIGLHFGESMQLTALGIVGQIITTSNSVGEALNKAASMVSLIADGFQIESELLENVMKIKIVCDPDYEIKYPYYSQNMRDFLAALVIHELDGLIVDKVNPISVSAPFSKDSKREFSRVLRVDECGYSDNIIIVIDKQLLGVEIISANYKMQNHLETLIKELPVYQQLQEESLSDRVRAYILNNSYLKVLSIDDVSSNFNLGSRTLQRKLNEENSSFKEIVDSVRKQLALEYLKDKNVQVKDVAYSLGYNESSAFVRAFKRWTGTSPSLYLKSL